MESLWLVGEDAYNVQQDARDILLSDKSISSNKHCVIPFLCQSILDTPKSSLNCQTALIEINAINSTVPSRTPEMESPANGIGLGRACSN